MSKEQQEDFDPERTQRPFKYKNSWTAACFTCKSK